MCLMGLMMAQRAYQRLFNACFIQADQIDAFSDMLLLLAFNIPDPISGFFAFQSWRLYHNKEIYIPMIK